MSIAADIIQLQIAHELGEHPVPRWRCPDCGSYLHLQRLVAVAEQGELLGRCHEAGVEHAWYHKHGGAGTWYRPAEDRGMA